MLHLAMLDGTLLIGLAWWGMVQSRWEFVLRA